MAFYGEDLAFIHAEGFGGLAEAAAKVVQEATPMRDSPPLVLDLGCGAGALSAALGQAGYRTWGLDISEAFIAEARRRVPHGAFVVGSVFAADLPKADAVCAIGEVVNYLADPAAGLDGLAAFFARAHAALPPGGLLLFDAAAPGRSAGGARAFTDGPGWAVGSIAEPGPGETLIRRIATFRQHASGDWRRSDETHQLQLWSEATVLQQLAQAGFDSAAAERGYGGFALPPQLLSYRAVKR